MWTACQTAKRDFYAADCDSPTINSHSQPSLDLSKDKTSPENTKTPPKTSPVNAGEEPTNDPRTLSPTQPDIQDKETAERKSPPASAKLGIEDADPAISQGSVAVVILQQRTKDGDSQ